MNQTWKNHKKPNHVSNFRLFGTNLHPQIFFGGFTSISNYALFQAIILCNLKENQCTKLEKIAKNLILDPILACLTQIWSFQIFLVSFTSTSS